MAERSISALLQLQKEDAVGQLRRGDGLMATLGSHNGAMKLDWIEEVGRLLNNANQLDQVEAEARGLMQRGIRYVIWSGMGGSMLPVQILAALGFCNGHNGITLYPLDSTDPQALNALVRQIAEAKGLSLPLQGMKKDQALIHTNRRQVKPGKG